MTNVGSSNFGPLIAYLIPGATALVGISPFVPLIENWFGASGGQGPTIGGFLYITVAATGIGMTVSAIRWVMVDALHALFGLQAPKIDFSRLGDRVAAFSILIEIHYRHYLFYGNMFVATAIAYAGLKIGRPDITQPIAADLAVLGLEVIFFATSRDTLGKYYRRSAQLLSLPAKQATKRHRTL